MSVSAHSPAEHVGQTDSISTVNLQASLHAATRSIHANLNRTITGRLPLCLPANATTPLPYHLGMLAFGSIYHNLERSIEHVIQEKLSDSPPCGDRLRHVQIVESLVTEGLSRSQLLAEDARTMHQRLLHTIHLSTDAAEAFLGAIEARVNTQAQARTALLRQRIEDKPYLALAYAWAMYLALFNGGRYLLKQLESAGPEFWLEDLEVEQRQRHKLAALSFWRFDAVTAQDPNAEQLKTTFKRDFDSASSMLTDEEAQEVVQEGLAVFNLCTELIEVLDTTLQQLESTPATEQSPVDLKPKDNADFSFPVWQTFGSVMLTPAYHLIRGFWSRPFRREASIAAG